MTYFAENRFLTIALAGSVVIHAVLLGVHFAAPDAFRLKPADPGLEVILVNARHDKAPVKADAIAQANLDGGGNANEGRAKSPLPDMRKVENGDSVKAAQRKVAELEAQQQKILSQMNKATPIVATPEHEKPKEVAPQINAKDLLDTAKAVARMEAEVAKNIEEYNKRPKKTQITARTREAGYALYYKAMQEKIERQTRALHGQNGRVQLSAFAREEVLNRLRTGVLAGFDALDGVLQRAAKTVSARLGGGQ